MTDAPLIVFLVLAALAVLGAVVWGLVVLAGRARQSPGADHLDAGLEVLQREIASVRGEGRRGQDATLAAVHEEVTRFGGQVGERLGQLQSAVAMELQQVTAEVNRRLQDGMALMQDAQKTMGQRL